MSGLALGSYSWGDYTVGLALRGSSLALDWSWGSRVVGRMPVEFVPHHEGIAQCTR